MKTKSTQKSEEQKPTQTTVQPQSQPRQELNINDAINKLAANTNTIRNHIMAIKLVGKGIDVEEMEKANLENMNLIIAFSQFLRTSSVAPLNRQQRRRLEREKSKV